MRIGREKRGGSQKLPSVALSFVAVLALFCACDNRSGIVLPFPDLSGGEPLHAVREARIQTDTGLSTVAVGAPATLSFSPGLYTLYLWTLEVPAGSTTTLSDAAAASPSFTPDTEGLYRVSLQATGTTGAPPPVDQASLVITAASYVSQTRCAACHTLPNQQVALTEHWNTLQSQGGQLFSNPGCVTCHTLGATLDPATTPAGGFDEEATAQGFDPATYTWVDYPTFAAAYPTLALRARIQCESCHGPGSLHEGDPRRIAVTTSADLCITCHSFGTVATEWLYSANARTASPEAVSDPACAGCHVTADFVRATSNHRLRQEGSENWGITCAACHDPHSDDNPSQVRVFGSFTFADGTSFEAGRAATCMRCHQSGVTNPAGLAASGSRFPCAVQSDMLASKGGVERGLAFSSPGFHGQSGMTLQAATGNPSDPNYPEACVVCHMAPTPTNGPLALRTGGHAEHLRADGLEYAAGNCDRCHAGLTTFDRNLARDFDGSGTASGVQTEIRGLLENLWTALLAADTGNGLSRPGGAGTPVAVAADLSLTTAALREAAYNYNFVVADGSFGVHNTIYAVQLLQRTYEWVTGVTYSAAYPLADTP